MSFRFKLVCASASVGLLTACGGANSAGAGGSTSVITPTPAPTPVPTPIPNATVLLPASLTAQPAPSFADAGGLSFSSPGAGAQLPLLLSAVSGTFGGDASTTEQGGILNLAATGSVTLSLNNPALGATNLALNSNDRQPIAAGQTLQVTSRNSDPFSRYISWVYGAPSHNVGGGVGLAGLLTRASQVPTSGQANFTGNLNGLISDFAISGGAGYAVLIGDVTVAANFSANQLSGQISNIRVGSDGFYVTGTVNPLTFNATFDPKRNLYVGEIVTGLFPGGPNGFQPGVKGSITLQLFGPNASEVGAVFVISDGLSRAIGSFGAHR